MHMTQQLLKEGNVSWAFSFPPQGFTVDQRMGHLPGRRFSGKASLYYFLEILNQQATIIFRCSERFLTGIWHILYVLSLIYVPVIYLLKRVHPDLMMSYLRTIGHSPSLLCHLVPQKEKTSFDYLVTLGGAHNPYRECLMEYLPLEILEAHKVQCIIKTQSQ